MKRLHDAHDEEAVLAEEVEHLEWLQSGIADGTGDGDNALYHAQDSSDSADNT
ncbi:MAG TPA: hypothetical protein VN778_04150 [Verrucomicrobiae bacterium]|nr:hypothetical protein [Verrucomicrobiae bacterium]